MRKEGESPSQSVIEENGGYAISGFTVVVVPCYDRICRGRIIFQINRVYYIDPVGDPLVDCVLCRAMN